MFFKTTPYKYQEEATTNAIRMLEKDRFMALFGEVGTGKTKIAIDTWQNMSMHVHHAVVICPKSLFSTWEKQLALHCDVPAHKIYRWDRIKKSGMSENSMIMNMLATTGYIFIVNVEAFQVENSRLEKLMAEMAQKICLCFLDESVKIQTPSANRTKRVIKFMSAYDYRVIMTGTDISSGVQALYTQFQALDKGFWKRIGYANFACFKAAFTISKKVYIQGGKQIDAIKRMDEMSELEKAIQRTKLASLNKLIMPHTIRILRKDCLDLPEQINVEVPIELSKEELRVYKEMQRDCIATIGSETFEAIEAISVFAKLRQIASGHCGGEYIQSCPSKLGWLIDDIEGHTESAIIVAYFHKDIEVITEKLIKEGYDAKSYYGGNSDKENEANKSQFEEGKLRFLVASHTMIAQGHNLQEHCALMYVYSVDLNSEVNAQYRGRIDRNGQTRHPVFKHLLAKDTIDEKIHDLISQKMNVQKLFSEMSKTKLIEFLRGEK